jgi:hypothetical protein
MSYALAMPGGTILINGSGVAARCCLRLLGDKAPPGVIASALRWSRPPALLISPSTQNLLADIFQQKDLFEGLPIVRKRIVSWGDAEPVVLPHSAVVVPEQVLLDRLRIPAWRMDKVDVAQATWTIFTAKPSENRSEEKHFGSRRAFVSEVELAHETDPNACWVESVDKGWLFLVSMGNGTGSLISVGELTEQLLDKSRLIMRQIRNLNGTTAEFAAYPRIASRLCGEGWLACGTAAMTFDPLCGEGVGNAAREAILASAAVQAILAGENTGEILEEYSLRLMLGFLRHLENCKEFYSRDVAGAFWSSELELIEKGMVWTRSQLQAGCRPRFRLVGFGLERIAGEESS